MNVLKFILLFLSIVFVTVAEAQKAPPKNYRPPKVAAPSKETSLRYDISAASGRYNDANYTEINVGLNWQLSDWWIWRNAAFHRFGTGVESLTGLDTSLRVGNSFATDGGGLGMDFFVGPGYRFATANANALFGEAGVGFKLGGIYLGVGAKSLYYVQTRTDSSGSEISRTDNQVFLIIAGGGVL